jgi:hypothetical protein
MDRQEDSLDRGADQGGDDRTKGAEDTKALDAARAPETGGSRRSLGTIRWVKQREKLAGLVDRELPAAKEVHHQGFASGLTERLLLFEEGTSTLSSSQPPPFLLVDRTHRNQL